MSEIDTLINQVIIGNNENLIDKTDLNPADHISENAFERIFEEAERDVENVTHSPIRSDTSTELAPTETASVISTTSKASTKSHRSEASTKVSILTRENLLKKEQEEEEKIRSRAHSLRSAKSNRSSSRSVKSTSSVKSKTDYTTLERYKKSLKHQVKKQHKLDLIGSPIEIIDRIDELVSCICSDCEDPSVRKKMIEDHRNTILIQVFLNTMNTTRRDVARACKDSMSKNVQTKLPTLS